MDVQRYISSGIIENHVVGLVSDSEARDVETAMIQYPEVKTAADAIRVDMERYVELWAQKPPAGIKRQLMDRLKNVDVEAAPAPGIPAITEPEETPSDNGYKPSINISPLQIWQYSAAAAVILLLVSGAFNLIYMNRVSEFQSKSATLENNQTALTDERDAFRDQLQSVQKELDLIKDPNLHWIRMQSVGKHTGAFATICWDPASKATYILAQSLPEPPADKQYQLWAIVNGKPIDAGVFELGDKIKVMQKVKEVTAAQVFAVTLEKKGGNPTPSLDQMFVAGKVTGI